MKDCGFESRHLGLITAEEISDLQDIVDKLAEQAAKSIDLAAISALAKEAPVLEYTTQEIRNIAKVKIAIASDKAFCFYYQDALDLLQELGAELLPFSPLRDNKMPQCDGLILGGGYPEVYAQELADNKAIMQDIKTALEANMKAAEYYKFKTKLIPDILKAYGQLSENKDIIVIEGAGSPAEINLKSQDIVNMGMAKMAKAPVVLVADIDRGGVFASIYGTLMLLEDDERAMVKGIIINKFRGDVEILNPGLRMIEDKTGIPVIGVIPMMQVDIEDEDSLSDRLNAPAEIKVIDIAVIRIPKMSNYTDFNVFELIPGVSVRYISSVSELGRPDMIVIPGTKNTIADLLWMRQNGIEAEIMKQASNGTVVFGVCGGYQILGRILSDPFGVEAGGDVPGMNLLPVETIFAEKKRTIQIHVA